MCKGGNPNTLKLKIKLWNNFKSLALSYAYKTILFWFDAFMMKNNQFRFFSRKIFTSLAGNFTMEKALFKNIFLNKFFMCQPILKFFVALFKTFGMQK